MLEVLNPKLPTAPAWTPPDRKLIAPRAAAPPADSSEVEAEALPLPQSAPFLLNYSESVCLKVIQATLSLFPKSASHE